MKQVWSDFALNLETPSNWKEETSKTETEDEETDEFIDELKSFRLDLWLI